MSFVCNSHCIQFLTGLLHDLRWVGDWFNVLDADFHLYLTMSAVAQLWRVRKPSSDGLITSWEAFDADGEVIVPLFGARKPGQPELGAWRWLAEATPALEGRFMAQRLATIGALGWPVGLWSVIAAA